jgi:NADH-quinone oxidoreductase subunit N
VGIGLLTTVFSLYYYANIIKTCWFGKEPSNYTIKLSMPAVLIIAIGLAGVIVFGLYPEPILRFASDLTTFMPR